jgi:hypothetical protein
MGTGLEALTLKVGIVAWTIICGIRLVVNNLNQSATQTYSWVYKYCWISIVKYFRSIHGADNLVKTKRVPVYH